MIKETLFATPIYVFDNLLDQSQNQQVEQAILKWSQEDPGVQKTNVNGWHSKDNMYEKQEFTLLTQKLFEAQFSIYQEEGLNGEPVLGNMWANINPKYGYNKSHNHANSLWSGVYYVKAPEQSGTLYLEDPRTASTMVIPKYDKQKHSYQWSTVTYEPMVGRCIMFPSSLRHGVNMNQSEDNRISVSFNFIQERKNK